MKKTVLSALFIAAVMQANAQSVTDTVSVSANYTKQVWYSLANDEQGNALKNNWDIAFDATGFGSSIMINAASGAKLWKYPSASLAGWATVDTTGLSTWATHWNSDTSWAYGAIGNYPNITDPYNLDWGTYNLTTHVVTGDSIYIIKLINGDYKKLAILSLSGSVYTFKFANLDGSSEQTATLDKSVYTGKNFGYYSLPTNTALDREPVSANWDLVFTQYTAFVPTAYTVTGILSNTGVQVAKVSNLPNKLTYTDYASATFSAPINNIGYNWKSFNGTAYDIKDSVVYFVKPANGDIWKMVFTGFDGNSTGNSMFTKEKLYTAPTEAVAGVNAAQVSLALYPNPSNGSQVNVIYSLPTADAATLTVTDLSGRTVHTAILDNSTGLQQYHIPAQLLMPGMYIVSIATNGTRTQQKLIIQ